MPEDKSTYKSQYVPLEDLIYVPLHAVAVSNMKLGGSIIELINNTGDTTRGPSGEEIIHLKTINLAYEKIKNDEIDVQHIEEIELKVPLMSVIPLSGLQVNNANLKFNIGINTVIKQGDKYLFDAEISTMNERLSDKTPKIFYDINLISTPAPEGLLRVIDILDISQIPKTLGKKIIDDTGRPVSGKQQEYYKKFKNLRYKENKLKKAHAKLTSLIEEKKRLFNNLNELQNKKSFRDFDEFSINYKDENLQRLLVSNPEISDILDLGLSLKKYMKFCEKIEDKLHSLREQQLINELNNIEEGLWDEQ